VSTPPPAARADPGAPALDAPRAVRRGDELDAGALAAWLARAVPDFAGVGAADLVVEQFGDGFSNLTYLLRAGAREVVLRRPPRGVTRGSAHDVLREHRLLVALRPTYGRVPRPVAACDDESVLGAPFYLMERVRGVILRGRPGEATPDAPTLAALGATFVRELAAIQATDWRAAGLPAGEGDYVERQVGGWSRRWAAARTGDVPTVERAAAWLAAHRPPQRERVLVHNDFKYDNLVLDPDDLARVRAVLDWEMATVGDPLMDLGSSLGYWLEPDDPPALRALGLGLTAAPGSPGRAALVDAYGRATGRDVSDAVFYFVYGVFKLAVVAQQIYARHVRGLTSDPRFARLDAVVAALGTMADRAVILGRIDRLA
jgi:aminoglycoside phosphotransferase (APT) family kinase protein